MSFPTLVYMQDPTGAYYTLSIETGGDAVVITPASAPTPPPNPPVVGTAAITIKLRQTVDWAKRFIGNRASVIGNGLEPAVTNANLILQTVLGPPFKWRWNRVITGFITTPGQQDYYLFNWQAQTAVGLGYVTVDGFGNSQKVLVAGTTGTSTPTWNNTPGGTTPDGVGGTQATWVNLGSLSSSTVSINYRFGWIEGAVCYDLTSSKYKEISPKIWLSQDSALDRPIFVAGQIDDGSGNIAFRLQPVPDQAYPVLITMQQKPGLFTGTNQTWSPIPDEYSRIYDYGFLSLMLLFADDPRYSAINQKFVAALLAANEGLDETERNIWLNSWNGIINQIQIQQNKTQQGTSARGQ
jgi:hypothetical protein